MRLFFTKKELKLRKKRVIMMIACMAVLLAGYLILTWPKKVQPEAPTVIVEPAEVGDVEIFGEYVGRIRAQQFVEVRARVEGYLESMLFAEGKYVTKNQVLFVINQDQYRAKADKARAQLKKDEASASWNVFVLCMHKMLPASWTWTMHRLPMKQPRLPSP